MSKCNYDLNTLPKWAQLHIKELELDILELKSKMETLQDMNAVMCEPKRDWFTLFNHDNDEIIHLWLLGYDQPISVCSLKKGDSLFVGRGKPDAK